MKKKNKVENSLERLFSAKKSDLVSQSDESTLAASKDAVVEPAQVEEKPPKKSDQKKATKPKKDKPEKSKSKKSTLPKNKEENVPVSVEAPIAEKAEQKPKPAKEVQPEPEHNVQKANEMQSAITEKPKTEIDKPMTDAIVASKSISDYDTDEHLVIFSLADQSYGISIMIVESIIKMQNITRVPRAHPSIEGATNLRGIVLPVIDLCKKLDLQASENQENKRIIVVAVEDITAGFVVDNVESVYRIPSKEISPPSPMVTSINTKYIKGIAKSGDHGLVIILDPIKIFESIIVETSDKNQIHLIK
ncbi:MAG: purine-binding chemotaxis protein CheW [Anaerolineaceae bacterium]|nr:purine-binding chemotaxis protein CheW [Anaerolineaceae bacterium]